MCVLDFFAFPYPLQKNNCKSQTCYLLKHNRCRNYDKHFLVETSMWQSWGLKTIFKSTLSPTSTHCACCIVCMFTSSSDLVLNISCQSVSWQKYCGRRIALAHAPFACCVSCAAWRPFTHPAKKIRFELAAINITKVSIHESGNARLQQICD